MPSTTTYSPGQVVVVNPSTARLSNLLPVEKKLVERVLGTLHPEDLARVAQGLREGFGL